jgi:hypothetical protein
MDMTPIGPGLDDRSAITAKVRNRKNNNMSEASIFFIIAALLSMALVNKHGWRE